MILGNRLSLYDAVCNGHRRRYQATLDDFAIILYNYRLNKAYICLEIAEEAYCLVDSNSWGLGAHFYTIITLDLLITESGHKALGRVWYTPQMMRFYRVYKSIFVRDINYVL